MLFSKYPIIGVGVGSTGALSGFVTTITSIGILGVSLLVWLLKELNISRHKGVFYAFMAIFITNLFSGDLSTFFYPFISILFAFSSKLNANNIY